MELDAAGLRITPIDKSKSTTESGHESSYSAHELAPNNLSLSSEGTSAFSPKSAQFQADDANDTTERSIRLVKLLKGKEREWAAVVEKKNGPLRLLDLPMDVLKEIVKEVTHTNDLTSLALTHSALHNLVIPLIYSRFDIVWPDANNTAEARAGVDALTYGLATLVMSENVFGDAPRHSRPDNRAYCKNCICEDCQNIHSSSAVTQHRPKKLRRGNYFAQFTRKFSLGNGPPDWVQEYLINKEGGKMLGTLVALSVARMPNLETFIWDMPTGILRDVWISLASLDDRNNGRKSRLEKMWIRFHDNRDPELGSPPTATVTQAAQSQLGVTPNAPNMPPNSELPETPAPTILDLSYRRTENPNFSILPPLKNLTVLDIDEPAYLDEISVLVAKSMDTLRELRIGIASTASLSGWASLASVVGPPWSPEFANGENPTTGGVFGMIMSKIYDRSGRRFCSRGLLQNVEMLTKNSTTENNESQPTSSTVSTGLILDNAQESSANYNSIGSESGTLMDTSLPTNESELVEPLQPLLLQASLQALALTPRVEDETTSHPAKPILEQEKNGKFTAHSAYPSEAPGPRKLRLEVLEMERIVIDVKVLQESINWSILSTLTLLQCQLHEQLWKALRRVYTPRTTPFAISLSSPTSKRLSSQPSLRLLSQRLPQSSRSENQYSTPDFHSIPSSAYRLNIKRIHTDAVSPALISFLKETLAPNSLEWMFLQDGREYTSPVTINAIFRGPIRHHRGSLTKVMIDSAIGKPDNARNLKRKKWMFPRELLAFITSGKMSRLKELAMAVDYKDWHFFVQRLPEIPHLRSLYVPYIADHVYGPHLDAKELALQLVDVVAIRPEIELCYLGFSTTCFELLENRHHEDPSWSRFDTSTAPAHVGLGGGGGGGGVDVTDDESDNDDDHEEDDDVNNPDPAGDPSSEDPEDSESDGADGSAGESDEESLESEKQRPILKLREILFYDDKVSIFKARHGRL